MLAWCRTTEGNRKEKKAGAKKRESAIFFLGGVATLQSLRRQAKKGSVHVLAGMPDFGADPEKNYSGPEFTEVG